MTKLPEVQVSDLIKSLNLEWLDEIYVGNIPSEETVDGTKTICLIQEIISPLDGYKNNSFSRLNSNIEVQLFFATNFKVSKLMCFLQVANPLANDGWQISTPYVDSIDPDTKQVTKTFEVSKQFLITDFLN